MPLRPGWVRSRKTVQAVALIAFVGLFDPILKRRLRKQRERQPVVSA